MAGSEQITHLHLFKAAHSEAQTIIDPPSQPDGVIDSFSQNTANNAPNTGSEPIRRETRVGDTWPSAYFCAKKANKVQKTIKKIIAYQNCAAAGNAGNPSGRMINPNDRHPRPTTPV